jgi:hypothetical protein
MKKVICSMRVVNDTAERGVKLVEDYLGSYKDEKEFQQLLQVVERNRKMFPDFRKKKSVN